VVSSTFYTDSAVSSTALTAILLTIGRVDLANSPNLDGDEHSHDGCHAIRKRVEIDVVRHFTPFSGKRAPTNPC
jgi:hypothetical protein